MLAFATAALPAEAALVAARYDVSVSSFSPSFGSANTSVIVSFDNGADITDRSVGLTVTGLPISFSGLLTFSYDKILDLLAVGIVTGVGDSASTLENLLADVVLAISGASSAVPLLEIYIFSDGSGGIFFNDNGSVRVSAVPEPASLALLGSVLVGFFAVARRRRARCGFEAGAATAFASLARLRPGHSPSLRPHTPRED